MYDEQVKALRICEVGERCDLCPKWDDKQNGGMNVCQTALCKEAADAIEELTRRCEQFQYMPPPAWVPVTERLPECEGERVLVASNFLTSYLRVSICYFSKNLEDVDKYDFDGKKRSGFYAHDPDEGYYERQCVRYWMPLPEPPKEE